MRIKAAPVHLKVEGRKFWRQVLSTYELPDCEQLKLLELAAECLDSIQGAREEIERKPYFDDRWGQTKQSPAFKVLQDNKGIFMRLIRELGLSLSDEQTRLGRRY